MVTSTMHDPSRLHVDSVGRLDSIEVEDFKSYKGLHIIGPFKSFTAVIGPNGSGKSNLMDAVSFVCGVKTAQLRANLEELLYRNTTSNLLEDQPKRGRVTLVFQKSNGTVIRFTRSILPSSGAENATYTSRYKVDSATVTTEDFMKRLLDIGINTKARNFLVFQGDIEKVAQKTPKDLSAFFEIVSGSDAYAAEYDELGNAVEQAEARVASMYQKHKSLKQRKRTMKQAKEEAEAYMREKQALEDKRREHFLWKLFHIKHDYEEAVEVKVEYEQKLEELVLKHTADRDALQDADKQSATLNKDRMRVAREVEKLQEQKDSKNPIMINLKEKLGRRLRELGSKQDQVTAKEAKIQSANSSLKERKKNLRKLEDQLKRVESDMETSIGAGINMTPEQLQEYRELKIEADQQVHEAIVKLRKEQDALKADQSTLTSLLSQLGAMQAQRDKLQAEVNEMKERLGNSKAKEKEVKTQLEVLNRSIKDLQGELRSSGTKRDQYRQQLEAIDARIQTLSSLYQTNRKERKVAETVSKLVELFPGNVHGRLSDVCKISNKKYNTAIAVLMGRSMDSVVVSTMAKARECIQYLKAERRDPMEFIPLDNITVSEPSERLRQLGGTAKLGADLVQCAPQLQKAVSYALGNALVADSLQEAKRLGFELRHKVCVVDGTLIAVNGSMSGGMSKSFADRSTRFDQAEVEKLRVERDAAQARLDALPDEQDLYQQEGVKRRELQAAQMQLNSAQADALSTDKMLKTKGVELANVQRAIDEKAPTADALRSAVEVRHAAVEKMEAAINRAKDAIFREFSRRVGIRSVREYEAEIESRTQTHEARRSALRRQAAELQSAVESLERTVQELRVQLENDTAAVEAVRGEVARMEQEKQDAATVTAGLDGKLADRRDDLHKLQAQEAEARARVKGAKSAQSKYSAAEGNLQREINRQQAAMTRLLDRAKGILQDMMLATVSLAPDSGGAADDGTAAMDADDDAAPLPAELRHNFAGLRPALRRTLDDAARSRTDRELGDAIEALQRELEEAVPNLKAPDEFAELLREEDALQSEMDEAKAAERDAHRRFGEVRDARTDLFNAAFDHVSGRIDAVYKALTRSAVNAIGGTAYLSKDQDDAPFQGGIKFSAIPPSKRFRDMEQLSGGEKTLAALALLMAVHSYKPSPFFVLDEVDAALDASNLSRVAHYIRSCTAEGSEHPFQGIIISLKDIFFEKADALVGVTRDWSRSSSQVFTYSLQAFGDPQP